VGFGGGIGSGIEVGK